MSALDRLAAKVRQAQLNINSPIALSEIERFERDAGITLPEDYREFLLHIANGGREPCRLVPLANWDYSYPLSVAQPTLAAAPCIVAPDSQQHEDKWIELSGVDDWEARWDRDEWCPMAGTIAVAEIGCGSFFSMVMNGKHRGRVFMWGGDTWAPPQFCPQSCLASGLSHIWMQS